MFIFEMSSSEKLCLQWNDFQNIVSSAFGDLKDNPDLTDVTLACEDGKQLEAHKMVLASTSPFFMELLKRNRHPHPLIYMRGIKSRDLIAMVEFLYKWEANVFQENLETFLALADEMRLKGLSRTDKPIQETTVCPQIDKTPKRTNDPVLAKLQNREKMEVNSSKPQRSLKNFSGTAIALNNSVEVSDLQMLDEQINSMMETGEKRMPYKVKGKVCFEKARICKVCGEEGRMTVIKAHIEAKHITGVTHTCDICGNSAKTKNSLVAHKSKYHRK